LAKGNEDLTSDDFLGLHCNFNQTYDKESDYLKPTFESTKDIEWDQENLNEPRAFTIKNIRDIFFSLMN